MKRSKKPEPAPPEEEKPEGIEEPRGRVLERPDGFYWQSDKDGKEYGPFTTLAEAEEVAQAGTAAEPDPQALQQAESELGINEWIDPDSGVPAEDFVPRLEDH